MAVEEPWHGLVTEWRKLVLTLNFLCNKLYHRRQLMVKNIKKMKQQSLAKKIKKIKNKRKSSSQDLKKGMALSNCSTGHWIPYFCHLVFLYFNWVTFHGLFIWGWTYQNIFLNPLSLKENALFSPFLFQMTAKIKSQTHSLKNTHTLTWTTATCGFDTAVGIKSALTSNVSVMHTVGPNNYIIHKPNHYIKPLASQF